MANGLVFLIGDALAVVMGANIGALTGLGWSGYFFPMTAVSGLILLFANAVMVTRALREDALQKYTRTQMMILSASVYVTCLAFIISDISKGVFSSRR